MKRELARVLDELFAGELSAGRRFEKLDMLGDFYSVRLNRALRLVFQILPDGSAKPVAGGPEARLRP